MLVVIYTNFNQWQ